jgi:hypothetical protein
MFSSSSFSSFSFSLWCDFSTSRGVSCEGRERLRWCVPSTDSSISLHSFLICTRFVELRIE